MLTIQQIDTGNKSEVNRFVRLPYKLYKNHPQWVPPPMADIKMMLNRDRHPFYEHSDADFLIAMRDGEEVGRIAVMENQPFNQYHGTHQAQFYLFECEDDPEAAKALFNRAFEWAHKRGLDTMVGPKGFGPLDGYGILVEGYDQRQMMTMMNYNYPYYPTLLESLGFTKEVDFVSCYLNAERFHMPERVQRIAERVKKRETLEVKAFSSKQELKSWASRIGEAYNKAFVSNWEYYPLSDNEITYVVNNIITVAVPHLIKVITHNDAIVGFLFGFPDVSAALQRARGKLAPWVLADLLLEMRRTQWIAINGAGILPEFHGIGGNALLYVEMEKTLREYGFIHADLTQVAETATQMRSDLENVGGRAYKNHRVYQRTL